MYYAAGRQALGVQVNVKFKPQRASSINNLQPSADVVIPYYNTRIIL